MAECIIQFQAGREAAMAGNPLDKRRSYCWREGWWEITRRNSNATGDE